MTLIVACLGALLAWAVSAPVYVLTGPAAAVSLAGLLGLRVEVHPMFRDVCFVVLGLAVGAGFSADALGTMVRWPLAFVVIAVLTWATMVACRGVLVRGFGFERDTALLAGAPGHLSFVIAMAESGGRDVVRISVTQSVRLLLLTLVVPFVALALGVDLSALAFAPGGLETMIAMGVVMGAVPGFVAACHMTRLMVLSVLLPLMARSGTVADRPLT